MFKPSNARQLKDCEISVHVTSDYYNDNDGNDNSLDYYLPTLAFNRKMTNYQDVTKVKCNKNKTNSYIHADNTTKIKNISVIKV